MKRSIILSLLLAVILVLWMASGQLAETPPETNQAPTENAPQAQALMKVEVSEPVKLERRARTLTMQGQLEPARDLVVRAEIAGTVETIAVTKGQRVNQGDLLVKLELDGRDSDLAQAQATLDTARTEYSAALKLSKQGLQSQVKNQQARATLAAAKASLERIERDIANLEIHAPFAGLINELPLETGEQIERGTPLAHLIDETTLIVVASVAQQSVRKITIGQAATVRLIDGTELQGEVTYLSAIADEKTHSFRMEVTIDNNTIGSIAGSSATVMVATSNFEGAFITPAMLSLGSDGELGVKSVNDNNEVMFYPVQLEQTNSEGAWVSGIPENARIITLGQGFVTPGQTVEPMNGSGE